MVIAALLHDIGHLREGEGFRHDAVGVIDHDAVGARYLRERGFQPGRAACERPRGCEALSHTDESIIFCQAVSGECSYAAIARWSHDSPGSGRF